MTKRDSVQKKLQRVRPPRVQLTYDVEIGDAIMQKEIPFVVGVLGDFSGGTGEQAKRLKERKFVQIDVDNFDDVMKGIEPRCAIRVNNVLDGSGGQIPVDLRMRSLHDFHPESVAEQVPVLRKLLDARARLSDLRNKLSGNDRLEDLLNEVLNNTEKLQRLQGLCDAAQPERG